MRLRIVAVGKDRSGLYSPAVEEYSQRIRRYARFEIVEVSEAKRQKGTPQAKDEEAGNVLAKLDSRERVVLVDERGDESTSVEFAERLGRWLSGGKDVALVLGGSDGHGEAVRKRAHESLALSRMTFAHRLARLVLAEQLYRGFTILRGEPYHK